MAPKPMYEDEETEDEEEDEVVEEEVVVAPTRKRAKKPAKVSFRITPKVNALTQRKQDPDRPKRALSAFFLYSQANRARVKEENPDSPFGEIVS